MLKKIAIGDVALIVAAVAGSFVADKLGLLDN